MEGFLEKDEKNEAFINLLVNIGLKDLKTIPKDKLLNKFLDSINLNKAPKLFISKLLNNKFDRIGQKIDLSLVLENNFIKFYEKIFERFRYQGDFLIIKDWKMSDTIKEGVLRVCLQAVCNVLIDEAKNDKTGKINIYESLLPFYSRLFSICSRKLININDELVNLEKIYPGSKLIEIYISILYRTNERGEQIFQISKSFNEHIRQYIEENAGKGAISLWYRLALQSDEERTPFLINELKKNEKLYTIQNKDYIEYPLKVNEKILLYVYLLNDSFKFFENGYITSLDYYKNSKKSCSIEELKKLSFVDVMKINNNITDFYRLFKIILNIKDNTEEYETFNENYTIFFSELSTYKEKLDTLNEIISFFSKFYPIEKSDKIKFMNGVKTMLNTIPLEEFDKKLGKIGEFEEYKKQLEKYKNLGNSIFFMEIFNSSKNKFRKDQEKEHFNYAYGQFELLRKLETDANLERFGKDFVNILTKAAKKNREKIMDELNLIKKYFGYNPNDEKFDVDQIFFELEKLIPDDMENEKKDILISKQESEEKIEEKEDMPKIDTKIFEDKFDNCYNYYLINKKKDMENKIYYEKYINYFKDIFGNEDIQKLNSKQFNECVLKRMIILYYSGIIEFTSNVYKDKTVLNELQLIKDFFEILEVYQSERDNKLDILIDDIKKIFQILSERFKDSGEDIFKGLTFLFSQIVKNDKSNEKLFSQCFINILVDEIKVERIKEEKSEILDLIFKKNEISFDAGTEECYLIENCIPIINYYFEETFFSLLKKETNINNKTIYFKDSALNLLDKTCENSLSLREQLLYYFETNINIILEERFPNNGYIKSDMIKNYVKKIRAYFKEKPKEKNLNENINLLFFISFLKVFYTKYIGVTEYYNNLKDDFYENFLNEEKFCLTEPLIYFALKIYLDVDGNFLDFLKLPKIHFSDDIGKNIGDNIEKDFGFDYLLIPFNAKGAKTFGEIYQQIIVCLNSDNKFKNDIGIIGDINKSNVDNLYCIISNLFLSKFSADRYMISEEYSLINKWLNEKLDKNEKNKFNILNECQKKILDILINMNKSNGKTIRIEYTKDLINFIFSLRFVLNSLSKNKDDFLYQLLIDTSKSISTYKNIFEYFFNDSNENESEKNKKNKSGAGFKLIKFIIFSHLIFAYLLDNIDLDTITKITNIKFEEKNITKALTFQFKEVQNILKFYGIKNRYSIIYMNIIFEEIKDIKLTDVEKETNLYNRKLSKINSAHFNKYFKMIFDMGMNEKMGMNNFKKIIFEEEYNYCIDNIIKEPSFIYFTIPNFCEINDFIYQYQFSNTNQIMLIDFILNKNMDEVINKINCLPCINNIVNKIYNEKNLNITRMKAMEEKVKLDSELVQKFNKIIPDIKKYFNIDFEKINENTKIFELINLKNNKLYNLYQSFEDNKILDSYNKLLDNCKKIQEINLDSKNIQDLSNADCFIKNTESNNYAYERLLQLIRICSKRNRYNGKNLNVYDGDKIIYDFKLIEKTLIDELIFQRKLLLNNQRIFIFSNEIFSGERKDLINTLKKQLEKTKKDSNENQNDKLIELKGKIQENEKIILDIYSDMQHILLHIFYFYIKNNRTMNSKISLKEICEKMKENGNDKINEIFYNENIFINDIIDLYTFIENILFDSLENIISNDRKLDDEYLKNEKKKEINKYFKDNKNLLLDKDSIANASKIYILRYCYNNYEKDDEILKNFDLKKIIETEDIWDNEIYNDPKFKEEMNDLIKFNDDNIDNIEQYILALIFKKDNDDDEGRPSNEFEHKEEEEEEEEKDEDDKSDKSDKSDDNKRKQSDNDD